MESRLKEKRILLTWTLYYLTIVVLVIYKLQFNSKPYLLYPHTICLQGDELVAN